MNATVVTNILPFTTISSPYSNGAGGGIQPDMISYAAAGMQQVCQLRAQYFGLSEVENVTGSLRMVLDGTSGISFAAVRVCNMLTVRFCVVSSCRRRGKFRCCNSVSQLQRKPKRSPCSRNLGAMVPMQITTPSLFQVLRPTNSAAVFMVSRSIILHSQAPNVLS